MRLNEIKIKTALWERDIKQKDLAKLSGFSEMTISGICNGASCRKTTALKIAKVLQMEIKDLLEDTDE